jgi:broad specificity phosphatase PhoE
VYNRVSIFEDHLIRDMKAGRFSQSTSLCLVTHGLTMRVFLMRWFNWTVESFLQVRIPKTML